MKRLIASIAILLIITSYLLSCEKDDLCAEGTPTTPGLVIDFYRTENPTALKSVTNFKCYVPGSTDTIKVNGTGVILPLKEDADKVQWALEYNYKPTIGDTISNVALMEIRYKRTDTYVSRACGFKTTFLLDNSSEQSLNPTVTDYNTEDNLDLYIGETIVNTPIIENEDETHINIYF
ncbi:DUF6452 family protein [Flavobacterium sp. NRK1]|uniref:DUF6452 family protein n=1 Tax=Flavobacterium sp. NRK1 TaxID=2954929 RepID=UPI00209395EF|nr:DUF6452 family protein [Flavobacterium sp. NRK1]MCO6149403.1 DUF6452 family protein [Flavobacterium sp. NRK1]